MIRALLLAVNLSRDEFTDFVVNHALGGRGLGMGHQSAFEDVARFLVTGRIADAKALLTSKKQDLQASDRCRYYCFRAEIELQSGAISAARDDATRVLDCASEPNLRAVGHAILGSAMASQLDFDGSRAQFGLARTAAGPTKSAALHARVELGYWRSFAGVLPLESAVSEFGRVRDAVVRSADPHDFVELRLFALRTEARKNCIWEARRHWNLARDALARNPNLRLLGQFELDGCLLAMLAGDLQTALDHAQQAADYARESGHFRSAIGAAVNTAHIQAAMGKLQEARRTVEGLFPQIEQHRLIELNALDCLAGILLAQHDVDGAERHLRQIETILAEHGHPSPPHWEALSILSTRIAVARHQGDSRKLKALLLEALQLAERTRDVGWLTRLRLGWAEYLLNSGMPAAGLTELARAVDIDELTPESIARASFVRSQGLSAFGRSGDAANQAARATRIAHALGSEALESELKSDAVASGTTEPRTLDDGATLIELASHPHVLAREAYALLEPAVAHLALVARSGDTTRVLTTRSWSESDAFRAATRPPTDVVRITCGTHREETLEILADPLPDLEHRCAVIAIRKLVDAAVTLDRYRREEKQRTALWPPDTLETDGGLWVSEQMTDLLSIGRRVAPSDLTVLLSGETGTGKEVLARAIHRASGRAAKPFIPFNCTAVARDMLESQLFGYRKGAFTGADQPFDGVIRAAAGGTLFLDEIAEIGPDLQPKLLRFLETHEVHGLGEPQPVKVDVRVIAATNADVESLVAEGRFRQDLFYRLNGVRLTLPPLRERREEIPPLIDHYLRLCAEEGSKGRLTVDDEAMEYLLLYRWPGNVRQLVNEIRRIVALAEVNGTVTPAMLSPEIQASRRTVKITPSDEPEVRVRLDQRMNDAVDSIEQAMVRRALERAHGNYETAARLLGISRKGLFLKRRRWGMERVS